MYSVNGLEKWESPTETDGYSLDLSVCSCSVRQVSDMSCIWMDLFDPRCCECG